VFETLRYLAEHHQITLLAPVHHAPKPEDLQAITDLGVVVVTARVSESSAAVCSRLGRGVLRGHSLLQGLHFDTTMASELRRLTSSHSFDVIHVEHSFMGPYLRWVDPKSGAKTVLSMHNIESLRFRREKEVAALGVRWAALTADHVFFASWEEGVVRQFDGIAAVSPVEEAWARTHAPAARVALVPNGVSVDHFRRLDCPAAGRRLVFSGLMNYPPNEDAVGWFCDDVLPIVARQYPDVSFTIVGDKPTPSVRALALRPGVEVTGQVPDVRPYLAKSVAAVVPLRSGAGTRLKILEAMAMQRPVVSTTIGAEGLDLEHGENILLADSREQFAASVCTLLGHPHLADRLGRQGERLVRETYDWRQCLRNLDRLYGEVTGVPVVHEGAACAAVER
jgi:glycosyltransferase involved in cell wall biosynthesis